MATRAELEAELERLRAEMAARPEAEPAKSKVTAPPQAEDAPHSDNALDRFLSEHDLKINDFEALLEQLSEELGNLPENKPVLTALGAFALGFLAGRMTK